MEHFLIIVSYCAAKYTIEHLGILRFFLEDIDYANSI